MLLVGPRRIGKTELLKQMVAHPPPGSRAVRVDLEGLDDVAGAVERVAEALWRSDLAPQRQMKAWLTNLRKVSLGGVVAVERGDGPPLASAWDALEQLFDQALGHIDDGRPLIVFLDEVPWWLDGLARGRATDGSLEERAAAGRDRVRQALAQLRYLRQREGLAARLRMVFTGSVGLAGLAAAAGASAELNDLWPYELRPLDEHAGHALFEFELAARGIAVDDAVAGRACALAGGSPHWIKQLASKLRRRPEPPTDDDVTAAAEQLLSPRMRHLFQDEAQHHLERRHGDRAPLLRALLSAAAASDHGATRPALLSSGLRHTGSRPDVERAIVQLVDEFYLDAEGDRFRFANPLFRRWWERYGHWG